MFGRHTRTAELRSIDSIIIKGFLHVCISLRPQTRFRAGIDFATPKPVENISIIASCRKLLCSCREGLNLTVWTVSLGLVCLPTVREMQSTQY